MIEFSEKLIQKTIKSFKEGYGVEFTREEASEALENLSGLFLAFAKKPKMKKNAKRYRMRL